MQALFFLNFHNTFPSKRSSRHVEPSKCLFHFHLLTDLTIFDDNLMYHIVISLCATISFFNSLYFADTSSNKNLDILMLNSRALPVRRKKQLWIFDQYLLVNDYHRCPPDIDNCAGTCKLLSRLCSVSLAVYQSSSLSNVCLSNGSSLNQN